MQERQKASPHFHLMLFIGKGAADGRYFPSGFGGAHGSVYFLG
jgi:hypothetical protein